MAKKEQRVIKRTTHLVCFKCDTALLDNQNCCPKCGGKVIWVVPQKKDPRQPFAEDVRQHGAI